MLFFFYKDGDQINMWSLEEESIDISFEFD